MSKYRIEVSPNNRAGCQDGFCKKNEIKILKGELRFGVWVETANFSSFRYKHWGCVSGFQVENMRKDLQDDSPGEYNWEFLDGLSELPPVEMSKIKTAITEGKIADEDFRGDPEFNILGAKGIRGRPKKEKLAENEEDEEQAGPSETPKKPIIKKRGRDKKEEDDDDDEQEHVKPVKKRIKKMKKEEDSDEEIAPLPNKKGKSRRAAKKEQTDEDHERKKEESAEIGVDVKPLKTNKSKRAAKKEEQYEATEVKTEEKDEAVFDVKPSRKFNANRMVPKQESEGFLKQEDDHQKELKPAKKSRVKKAAKEEEIARDSAVKLEKGKLGDVDADPAVEGRKIKKDANERHNGVKKEDSKIKNEYNVKADVKPTKNKKSKKTEAKNYQSEDENFKMEDIDQFDIEDARISKPNDAEVEEAETKRVRKSRSNALPKKSLKKEEIPDAKSTFSEPGLEDNEAPQNVFPAPVATKSEKKRLVNGVAGRWLRDLFEAEPPAPLGIADDNGEPKTELKNDWLKFLKRLFADDITSGLYGASDWEAFLDQLVAKDKMMAAEENALSAEEEPAPAVAAKKAGRKAKKLTAVATASSSRPHRTKST